MLMTEEELGSISPQAWRRKRNIATIVIVFWLILFLLAVHAWTNPTIEYYGRIMAVSDLVALKSALYCAPRREPQWYREIAAHFPVIPRNICFDTQQEAMDYFSLYTNPRTIPPPTAVVTPTP